MIYIDIISLNIIYKAREAQLVERNIEAILAVSSNLTSGISICICDKNSFNKLN